MFIHFGMSTFTGHEFGGIPAESKVYAPTDLDVDQWIRVASEAGMNYAVLTTKHCYGHCLWDSHLTDYDVATSSDTTDVVRAFVEACRRHGVKPGFYYLLGWDKHNQKQRTPEEYEAFCTGQIEELLTNYGPITELWLDIPWDMGQDTDKVLARIYAKVKSIQPNCLILLNQGFVDGSAVIERMPTYVHKETGRPPVLLWPKDLNNGEITPPPAGGHNPHISVRDTTYYLPTETCETLAHHWFWVSGDALKSVRTLYRLYKSTVLNGANLLLDLAPDLTGQIPETTTQRLMALKKVFKNPALIRPSLTFGAKTTASNVYQNDPQYDPVHAVDNDSGTRWATDEGVGECWIQVELGHSCDFDGAYISESWNGVQEFTLEIRESDGSWRTFYSGSTIGISGATVSFPKTSGQIVRFHILKATSGPTIWDFELYDSNESH